MLPPIPTPITTIGPLSIRSFTLWLSLAVIVYLTISIYLCRYRIKPAIIFETTIALLILGIIGARLGHVWLHWDYFSSQTSEVIHLRQGGLNWHGALLTSSLGYLICCRVPRWQLFLKQYSSIPLSFAFPIFTFAIWRACRNALCAYGRELESLYGLPAWFAGWSADIFTRILPRYNTSSLGSLLAVTMFTVLFFQIWRNVTPYRSLITQIVLLSLGMWFIGNFRGDPVPTFAGQRADQWLDFLVFLVAAIAFLRDTMHRQTLSHNQPYPKETQWQTTTSS